MLSEESEYSLVPAAIVHDVGHLGATDQFLMENSPGNAVRYDHWFPMEMMHRAKLVQVAGSSLHAGRPLP